MRSARLHHEMDFPGDSDSKELQKRPIIQDTQVSSLGWEDPLEKGMVTHSSILAWRIPWTEEPGELHSSWGCKESVTERLTLSLLS